METLRRPLTVHELLEGDGVEIGGPGSAYVYTIKPLKTKVRGERVVRADVEVGLGWGKKLRIDFRIPSQARLLEVMLQRLRPAEFKGWLDSHGYDQEGVCVEGHREGCTFGDIVRMVYEPPSEGGRGWVKW